MMTILWIALAWIAFAAMLTIILVQATKIYGLKSANNALMIQRDTHSDSELSDELDREYESLQPPSSIPEDNRALVSNLIGGS